MKVQTTKLQNMVAKSIKGTGDNKLIKMTSMMGIDVAKGTLCLTTTDATSYLYIFDKVSDDTDTFNCAVAADIFAKLVGKLTNEYTELELTDNTLVVTSNGKYRIALEPDENGEPIKIPNPCEGLIPAEGDYLGILSVADIEVMNDVLKPSLSTNVGSCYANYIVGQFAVATDRAMLSGYTKELFKKNLLFTRNFVELLGLATDDVMLYHKDDDVVIAEAVGVRVYTKLIANKDISDYSVDGVNKMLSLEYASYCKIKKSELLNTLERIAIFVGAYDEGAVNVSFTQDGIEVFSKQDRGAELVEYMEIKDFKDYSMKIDINRWIAQLKAYKSDSVDLYFGNPMCIKMTDGDISQIIALIA